MCDYSLEIYRSRPAAKGERYVLDRFPSGSKGFSPAKGCGTAVCMEADTRIRLEGISEPLQTLFDVESTEEAVMIRLDTGPYRDGVRFRNGREASLQRLNDGVTASVIAFVGETLPPAEGDGEHAAPPREYAEV